MFAAKDTGKTEKTEFGDEIDVMKYSKQSNPPQLRKNTEKVYPISCDDADK